MLRFELAIRGQSTDDSHMSVTLSDAEAKHLLQLCKAGRLLEIQDWISSGKSLCMPSDSRTTPLKTALDTGFHSLVELLVRNEASQEIKNRALRKAVSLKTCCMPGTRTSFVTFLITAPISSLAIRLPSLLVKRSEPPLGPGKNVNRNIHILPLNSKNRPIEL
jgi:hypothetical protein